MRYGIFADIHSNLEALDTVIAAYRKETIDKYFCVGDVVGYAANPNECAEKIKALCEIAVAGNHDWAAVNLLSIEYFNPVARQAILWTRDNLDERSKSFLESLKLIHRNNDLTLVHGTLDNPQDFNYMIDGRIAQGTFELLETKICFVGHSHIAGIFIKHKDGRIEYCEEERVKIQDENSYIVNVGSIGQPRDNNPRAAYSIYDTDKKEIQIKRADYDIQKTRERIINAGLPRFLGDRLIIGR
jgi:predicted phosphodiesterase